MSSVVSFVLPLDCSSVEGCEGGAADEELDAAEAPEEAKDDSACMANSTSFKPRRRPRPPRPVPPALRPNRWHLLMASASASSAPATVLQTLAVHLPRASFVPWDRDVAFDRCPALSSRSLATALSKSPPEDLKACPAASDWKPITVSLRCKGPASIVALACFLGGSSSESSACPSLSVSETTSLAASPSPSVACASASGSLSSRFAASETSPRALSSARREAATGKPMASRSASASSLMAAMANKTAHRRC
mmetsp:Transcript_96618/g.242372  ORF Transcript_96618/g.242372 Transcript_96618/m.242372 type:complete len:252 (-) Transcript_96618:13-768(-)